MGVFRRQWPGVSYGRGEDWHYVGEAGEPAFGTDWINGATDNHLAFRIRETGVVDVQGFVENSAAPTAPATAVFFTLPVGYRPSADTYQGTAVIRTDVAADGPVVAPIGITTTGDVVIVDIDTDPIFTTHYSGAYSGVAYRVTLQGQFFLVPASAP